MFAKAFFTKPTNGLQLNRSSPLSKNLIGYWPMIEGGGAFTRDYAKENSGTLTNGATWYPTKLGTGVKFDGTDDFVNMGTDQIISDSLGFTVIWWQKNTTSIESCMPFRFKNTTNEFIFAMARVGNARFLGLAYYFGFRGFSAQENNTSGYFLDDNLNKEICYAVTFNGVDKDADASFGLYFNGYKLYNSKTISPNTVGASGASNPNTNIFGKNSDGFDFLNGTMSQVMLFNKALTQSEIIQARNNPFLLLQGKSDFSNLLRRGGNQSILTRK